MSRTYRRGERHIRARGIPNSPPDLRRAAKAFIELGAAQAEADAQALVDPPRSRRTKTAAAGKAEQTRAAANSTKEVA